MTKWLWLTIFAAVWVAYGVYQAEKRTVVHQIVLFVTLLVAFIACVTAVRHYQEVRFLKTLDVNDVISVSVGDVPKVIDREQLQNVVAALRSPEDFVASRDNHGNEIDFTLAFKDGTQKVFTISRAAKTHGAVVRIKGGGTVLYEDLEWLIPASR